jgi:uncharacterized protein (DUF2384 family)
MTSTSSDDVTTAGTAWLATLRNDLTDLLAHTSTTDVLDEETRLKVKDVLHRLDTQDAPAMYQGRDPYLVEQLLAGCMSAALALSELDPATGRSRLRVSLERARQAARDIVEQAPVAADTDIKDVVRWLVEHSEVSQRELADLLGTTTRTLQRWISPAESTAPVGDQAILVRTLAGVLSQLRHLMTPGGTIRWLATPNTELDGRRPRDLLSSPEGSRLVSLASSLRATVAA